MLPGVPGGKNALKDLARWTTARCGRAEAIIRSMTREERQEPAIIGGSRRLRIARGSGATTADVNALLKEFERRTEDDEVDDGRQAACPGFRGMPNIPGLKARRGTRQMTAGSG